MKRSKPKRLSKEEFVAMYVRNSSLLFGETPSEEDINRSWDLVVFERQYKSIRTKTGKAAFFEYMEQEMTRRYPPATKDTKGDYN
jgi:hypothetical protein